MRGSLKVQIGAALKCCTRIGTSRHDAKLQHGGRSPYIHAMGTLDKIIHRLWPLQAWLKSMEISDLELLTDALVQEYLDHRLQHHVKAKNSRKSFQVEVSALGNLERGLNFFSQEKRKVPVKYDFSKARKRAALKAKTLQKTTSTYDNRALTDALQLINAIQGTRHKLMALLQIYCGCRAEGVGAPRRKAPDRNWFTMANLQDVEGKMLPRQQDPVTGQLVQPFWTKEKGGKIALKYAPSVLADELVAWLKLHPEGLGDTYESYLAAINRAMKQTGQYVKGKGTHALRFTFAQERYLACILPPLYTDDARRSKGMGDEEAKRQVSRELSHNRADITECYLR